MTSKNNNEHIEPEKQHAEEAPTSAVVSKPNETDTSNTEPKESTIKETPSSKKQPSKKDEKFEEKHGKRGVKLGAIAIVIAIIFGGGLTFKQQQNDDIYRAQISALQTQLTQSQNAMKSDLEQVKEETINKATEVSHKAEVVLAQQQKSIESLQLAIADVKGRRPNDWLLAEADYLVKLAGRKLFLEHDVVSATKLMETADQRIAALNDPSLVSLRKAMADDITKLKVVPLIDRDGLILRLTALQQQVDSLPLANAILPEAQMVEETSVSSDIYDWQDNLMASLKGFSDNFITFRTRDGNVIPLLSPQQHFYLKENVKAKLETAIKAVYVEQGEIYTTAITTANEWSKTFFNQSDSGVIEFNTALDKLAAQNVQVDYPVKLTSQQKLSDVITDRLRREVTTLITEDK